MKTLAQVDEQFLHLPFAKRTEKQTKETKTMPESLRTIIWVGAFFKQITKIAFGCVFGKKNNFHSYFNSYFKLSFMQMKYLKM